jgi:hypothetical protein
MIALKPSRLNSRHSCSSQGAEEVGIDAVFSVHYEGVRLAQASYSAVECGADESAAFSGGSDAECMGLDGIYPDDVVDAVPFDCSEWLEYCRAPGLGIVDFFRLEEFQADFFLGLVCGCSGAEERSRGCCADELSSSELACHSMISLSFMRP